MNPSQLRRFIRRYGNIGLDREVDFFIRKNEPTFGAARLILKLQYIWVSPSWLKVVVPELLLHFPVHQTLAF